MSHETHIASLDVGTTTIRCQIINSRTQIVGSARAAIKLIYPHPGYVEIDPDQLWDQVIQIIKDAISNANLNAKDIKCLGISTQRATFTTWRKDTGKHFHNFITWKDIRVKELCKELNSSLVLKSFRWSVYTLHLVTRSQRFLTGSRLQIAPNHVTARLLWTLKNVAKLKEAVAQDNAMFGTLDTWLIYKFSSHNLHVTDISNASATGFFDPFVSEWGSWAKLFLGIPITILPEVVGNDFNFGLVDEVIFGTAIPIRCVMADQSSSMFASCCFATDDIKITLGTGAFLDVNTAAEVHASVTGIYPLIAWKINNELVNLGEVACNDCGSLIEWLLNVDIISNPAETFKLAVSVGDNDGVYFIPAFSGLGPPINDVKAASGFLGVKPTTNKGHLVRAVLEGIVFRVALAYNTLQKERSRSYQRVIIDGGVSKNDFVCQLLADLTGLYVERLDSSELSVWGVAFVAGISIGVWKDRDQLKKLRIVDKIFQPSKNQTHRKKCMKVFDRWLDAVTRFKSWYKED